MGEVAVGAVAGEAADAAVGVADVVGIVEGVLAVDAAGDGAGRTEWERSQLVNNNKQFFSMFDFN